MLGQLGCGDYQARVVTRGALAVVWEEITFTSLQYERVLDDTSSASLVLDGVINGCAEKTMLAKIFAWRHELAIYRAGQLVWIGPVTGKAGNGARATLRARDRSTWWYRRFIHVTRSFVADLTTIFLAYTSDAMAPDPVAGFTVTASPTGITGDRTVQASDFKIAGGEIAELSKIGIDWTVLGPACVAGGRSIPAGRLPVIADEHLRSTPDVDSEGLAQVNRQVIIGQQPQDDVTGQFVVGDRVNGIASDATRQALDGLLEGVTQDDKAADTQSCVAGAQSDIDLYGDEPTVISNLDLGPNAPMTMDQLIPGAIVDVELVDQSITVSDLYRIAKVTVTVDTNGERVKLDVQPVGTP